MNKFKVVHIKNQFNLINFKINIKTKDIFNNIFVYSFIDYYI